MREHLRHELTHVLYKRVKLIVVVVDGLIITSVMINNLTELYNQVNNIITHYTSKTC